MGGGWTFACVVVRSFLSALGVPRTLGGVVEEHRERTPVQVIFWPLSDMSLPRTIGSEARWSDWVSTPVLSGLR